MRDAKLESQVRQKKYSETIKYITRLNIDETICKKEYHIEFPNPINQYPFTYVYDFLNAMKSWYKEIIRDIAKYRHSFALIVV